MRLLAGLWLCPGQEMLQLSMQSPLKGICARARLLSTGGGRWHVGGERELGFMSDATTRTTIRVRISGREVGTRICSTVVVGRRKSRRSIHFGATVCGC